MPFPSKTTRESILQAALEMVLEHGLESFSTRKLAEVCGIKAPSLYRYFPEKNSLLEALAALAAEQLQAQLTKIRLEPKPALHKAAELYLEFAQKQPPLYDLLMQPRPSSGVFKALWNTFLALIGAITKNPDDTANAVAFWAFLHGYATLERNGAFGASGAGAALTVGLETWLRGLEKN